MMRYGLIGLAMLLGLGRAATMAQAAVERLEVTERKSLAGGQAFGAAGPYEKLRGRAIFALDPRAPANAAIADLQLAPRNARGLVEFSADFVMMRPVDAARGNGTLLYDVANRGNLTMLTQLNEAAINNDPTSPAELGNAFLMQQGFTLLWSAWAWDIYTEAKDRKLVLEAPIVTERGKTITGKVAFEIIVDAPSETAGFVGNQGLAYAPAQPDAPDAVLTVRESQDGKRQTLPRAQWRFVAPTDERPARQLMLTGGFQPSRIYELVYTARDPVVVAAGLAGIPDLLAHFRRHP